MEFNTKECAWSNITLTILGRKLTGLRGFEVKKTVEKEHVYASSDEPVDIQSGNKKYEGSFKMLKYELDMMNDAAQVAGYSDVTEVPHTLITANIEFKKNLADKIRIISVPGVAFTELTVAMEQNAKMTEVTLPYLAMRILHTPRVGAGA
jgi:hypothetical protein